jgi:Na+/melibiose symporter-like transporter
VPASLFLGIVAILLGIGACPMIAAQKSVMNRRALVVSALLWQGGCSAVLAVGAWTRVIDPISILICIFALGIGLAFGAPVLGAIVPDIVSKDELPSAITLGGVQLNCPP